MAERRPPGFNVDLGFYDSDEVLSIPRRIRVAAVGVWTLCGSYSANKLTDGYVSAEVLKQQGCTPAIRTALMSTTRADRTPSPLWVDAGNGAVQFTRWQKWQRTSAEVKAYRDAEAERKRKSREAKQNGATSTDSKMSGRTSAGQSTSVRPEDGDPKTKTETETKTETKTETTTGVTNGVSVQPVPADTTHTPLPEFCPRHPHGTTERCGDCANIRKANNVRLRAEEQAAQHRALDAVNARQAELAQRTECPDCDPAGWLLDDSGEPVDPARRCTHPKLTEPGHA